MVEFVAADASTADQGHRTFQIGVALEVDDGSDFDEYYFDFVDKFTDRYDLELGHNIIKAKDIVNRIPSFQIIDAEEFAMENLGTSQPV